MNAMRRLGFGLGLMTLLATAAGCGSSNSGMVGGGAKSPAPEEGALSDGAAQVYVQPSQPGGDAPASPAFETSSNSRPSTAALTPPSSAPQSSQPSPAVRMQQRDVVAKGASEEPARRADKPLDRPGLGTEWGETRFSRITTVPFVRADQTNPFAVASFFYNDEQGARDMANLSGFRRFAAGSIAAAGGVISLALRDEGGHFLSGFAAGDKSYVVGEAGRRYVIVIHNNTDNRLEVVLSVDGLDVLDGKAASFNKRGYLVDPRADVEIDGFRQSVDTVAAFRFGSVRGSYAAQKTGDARNVGVIGVAIFNERGTNPFNSSSDEAQRRRDANPFPGQFATPP